MYLVVPLFVALLGADVRFLVIVAGVYTVLLVDVGPKPVVDQKTEKGLRETVY